MKRFLYYLILTVTALAVVVLLGIAVGIAVVRPDAHYASPIPDSGFPDYARSAFFLMAGAPVCFAGSLLLRFLNYDGQKER